VESSPTRDGLTSHCHERLNYTKRDGNMRENGRKMNVRRVSGSQWLSSSSSSSSRVICYFSTEVPFFSLIFPLKTILI